MDFLVLKDFQVHLAFLESQRLAVKVCQDKWVFTESLVKEVLLGFLANRAPEEKKDLVFLVCLG